MIQQILLSGPASSGRGVRFKTLSAAEVDKASIEAARMIGKDGLALEYGQAKAKELVTRMLVSVTREGGYKSPDDLLSLPASAWLKIDLPTLLNPSGQYRYDELFTARDDGVLCSIASRLHIAREDEVDAIMGKALMVSED